MSYKLLPQAEKDGLKAPAPGRLSRAVVGWFLALCAGLLGFWYWEHHGGDWFTTPKTGEKHLVIASMRNQDVSWLSEIPPECVTKATAFISVDSDLRASQLDYQALYH